MEPLYVSCPHCEFPAVIKDVEQWFGRYCRQCGMAYTPGKVIQQSTRSDRGMEITKVRKRRLVRRAVLQPPLSRNTTLPRG